MQPLQIKGKTDLLRQSHQTVVQGRGVRTQEMITTKTSRSTRIPTEGQDHNQVFVMTTVVNRVTLRITATMKRTLRVNDVLKWTIKKNFTCTISDIATYV